MFWKSPRPRKVRFINLAEHLALQNERVTRAVDGMLLHVLNNEDVQARSDWPEIRKMIDQTPTPTSNSAARTESPFPQPKSSRPVSGVSPESTAASHS